MVDFDDTTDDLDELIDRAVDTFFVEEPETEERVTTEAVGARGAPSEIPEPQTKVPAPGPSFEEALDTLFVSAFQEEQPASSTYDERSWITSGDDETDRAIDLAVDTLFVEEPESAAPETAALDVKVIEAPTASGGIRDLPAGASEQDRPPTRPRREVPPLPPPRQPARPVSPVRPSAQISGERRTESTINYDDTMAREVRRHMHTLYKEASQERSREAAPVKPPAVPTKTSKPPRAESSYLRNLQEAILTLEWEISQRSVTALAGEIRKVRAQFKDNVTVDFAALSMRVVLDYVVKRMSRAHPESIRFLLDMTEYLGKSLNSSVEDPLEAFHHILTRYEKYKTAVRQAEGIPDPKPQIVDELSIKEPDAFARTVTMQALTLKRAGQSLVEKLSASQDPENLIRSFRFLVNRALNRILEGTCGQKPQQAPRRKSRRGERSSH
jgi:hypothetical protein